MISDEIAMPFGSPAEVAFHRAWLRIPGAPELSPQHPVGRFRLDFAIPEQRIGVEVDGYEYHHTREQFIADRKRQRIIEMQGWTVVRFAAVEVLEDAGVCAHEVAMRLTAVTA